MGYRYSVYLDGDTFCDKPIPSGLSAGFHLAGHSYDTVGQLFTEIGDYAAVDEKFPTARPNFGRARIQTGVLVYDHTALCELGYFERAARLYDTSIKQGIPRKGDDSLLALMLVVHPDLRTLSLPRSWNTIDYLLDGTATDELDRVAAECIIYHFVKYKPWWEWSRGSEYPTTFSQIDGGGYSRTT